MTDTNTALNRSNNELERISVKQIVKSLGIDFRCSYCGYITHASLDQCFECPQCKQHYHLIL